MLKAFGANRETESLDGCPSRADMSSQTPAVGVQEGDLGRMLSL